MGPAWICPQKFQEGNEWNGKEIVYSRRRNVKNRSTEYIRGEILTPENSKIFEPRIVVRLSSGERRDLSRESERQQ